MSVFEKIEAQQKGREGTPAWMVGEQLKDICRREPESAALVEKDLDAITLDSVAAKIKAHADKEHAKNKQNCVCVPPQTAEKIIREAYGLPEASAEVKAEAPKAEEPRQQEKQPEPAGGLFLSLDDFL